MRQVFLARFSSEGTRRGSLTHAAEKIRRLERRELPRDTIAMAKFLIGCTLVHDVGGERLAGRIVETEAYLVGDAASHAYRGLTKRNPSMFLPRGHAYVYISYGVWPMLNVSSMEKGVGEAVLIRALEPIEGVEAMRRSESERVFDIARGPGRLARAMHVTLAHDGVDLCGGGPLFLGAPVRKTPPVGTSIRIGITKDADRKLRFFERGSPFVSGSKRLNSL
jgi:DNA-3-methyladenine glycosylase